MAQGARTLSRRVCRVQPGPLGLRRRRDHAQEHARWIVDLERDAGLAFEHSVQRALDSGATAFLLSNAYLAAQLLVLPGSLIWLYRRSPEARGAVIAPCGSPPGPATAVPWGDPKS
jgi:hypothetical protein